MHAYNAYMHTYMRTVCVNVHACMHAYMHTCISKKNVNARMHANNTCIHPQTVCVRKKEGVCVWKRGRDRVCVCGRERGRERNVRVWDLKCRPKGRLQWRQLQSNEAEWDLKCRLKGRLQWHRLEYEMECSGAECRPEVQTRRGDCNDIDSNEMEWSGAERDLKRRLQGRPPRHRLQ